MRKAATGFAPSGTRLVKGEWALNNWLSMAQFQRRQISQGWVRALNGIKAKGRHKGGSNTPYGYSYDLDAKNIVPDPDQAEIVREVFARYVAGASLRTIAHDLNDRKVDTQRGGEWRGRTLADILENPTYIGMAWDNRDGDRQLVPMKWKPIIDRETWDKAQTLRAAQRAAASDNGRRGGGRAPKYLLSGLAVCGACGRTLCHHPGPSTRDRSQYACPGSLRGDGCRGGVIDRARAEEEAHDLFMEVLEGPWMDAAFKMPEHRLPKKKAPDYERRIAKIDRQIANLIDRLAVVPERQVKAVETKLAELDAERAALEAQRAVEDAHDLEAETRRETVRELRENLADLDAYWDHWSTDERRDMLRLVFSRIEMVPGTRPKRLHFEVYDDDPWVTDDIRYRLENWERVRAIKQRVDIRDVLRKASERA
jgi:hypothetical protein